MQSKKTYKAQSIQSYTLYKATLYPLQSSALYGLYGLFKACTSILFTTHTTYYTTLYVQPYRVYRSFAEASYELYRLQAMLCSASIKILQIFIGFISSQILFLFYKWSAYTSVYVVLFFQLI